MHIFKLINLNFMFNNINRKYSKLKLIFIFILCAFQKIEGIEAQKSLAICTLFQNESKYLPEWIEFHENQGASHFFLYNHFCTENWQDILKKYIDRGLVEVINWPYEYATAADWTRIQCRAYMDAALRSKGKYQWCAFLDSDEFLFSVEGLSLCEVLKEYKYAPGVVVNWVMYGTSHVEKISESEKMLDLLIWRAPLDFPANLHFKTIAKPEEIKNCFNPHGFIFHNGKNAVDENHQPKAFSDWNSFSVNKLRINHYWSRDKEFFYQVKIARRFKFFEGGEEPIAFEAAMNVEYDPILSSKKD